MNGARPEMPGIHIQRAGGRKLRCRAGKHVVFTDRKEADGGTDAGCTSGELLLISIGSCAAGSVRRFLDEHGLPSDDLELEVRFEEENIVIEVLLLGGDGKHDVPQIGKAALSGGVVSRLARGSGITVRCRQADAHKT